MSRTLEMLRLRRNRQISLERDPIQIFSTGDARDRVLPRNMATASRAHQVGRRELRGGPMPNIAFAFGQARDIPWIAGKSVDYGKWLCHSLSKSNGQERKRVMVSSKAAKLRATLSLWFVLFVIWTAANGTLAPAVSGLGLALTFMISVLCTRAPGVWKDLFFTPARAISFLRYTAVFLREMVKSNLTVLGLVFSPKVKVRPGIVLAHTRLASPFARLVLSNSVALTPGSLVLGLDGSDVYVHGLDLSSTDKDANTQEFLGPFEPVLLRTFG